MSLYCVWANLTYRPLANGGVPFLGGFDENCYYAIAHSLFFDRDVSFSNQFTFLMESQPHYLAEAFAPYVHDNPDAPVNIYPAGSAIAALPAFVLAAGIDNLRAWVTRSWPVSNFSLLYVFAYSAAQVSYGIAALLVCWSILMRWFSRGTVLLAVAAVVFCGPWLFYQMFDPAMAHLCGAFFNAAAVWAWLRWREEAGKRAYVYAALTGLCIGFATMVRPYNAPFALLLLEPLVSTRFVVVKNRPQRVATLLAIFCGFLGFLPQLVCWRLQHGTWVANTSGHTFALIPKYALHLFFHPNHGLLYWSPAFVLSLAGLIIGCRRMRHPAVVYAMVLCGIIWMYGNWRIWWLGVSFGMRGFIDAAIIFAFGFAVIFDLIRNRYKSRGTKVVACLLLLFCLLNVHLLIAYRSRSIPADGNLQWHKSLDHPEWYIGQLRREWLTLTDLHPERRVSLFARPRR